MPPKLLFVPTDGAGNIKPAERRLIRSHCMHEKNKKPTSRRSRRAAARAAVAQNAEPVARRNSASPSTSAGSSAKHPEQFRRSRTDATSVGRPIPPLASDWALIDLPSPLDLTSQRLMHQFYFCNPIRDILSPFKYFGISLDFNLDPVWCFQKMGSEPLYFRMMLMLTSASSDLMLRQPFSRDTQSHLRHLLPLLNQHLSDRDAHESDLALYVVAVLATVAVVFGDDQTARRHALGLSRILHLRGGFAAENYSPVLQLAIDRLNFYSSLVSAAWPPLFDIGVWKAPVFPADIYDLYQSHGMISLDSFIAPELAPVIRTLQYTTIILNESYHDKQPADGLLLRQCLGAVHSGLVELEGRLPDPVSECLRLGAMTLLASTYRLPDMHQEDRNGGLVGRLRRSYVSLESTERNVPLALKIWFQLILRISTEGRDSGLEHDVYADWNLSVMTRWFPWEDVLVHVKRIIWIDAFHIGPGKKAWETMGGVFEDMGHDFNLNPDDPRIPVA